MVRRIRTHNAQTDRGTRYKQDRASGAISSALALPIVHVMAPAQTDHRNIGFHGHLSAMKFHGTISRLEPLCW